MLCRHVIEKVEPYFSEVRKKNTKAPRLEVWKDIFKNSTLAMTRMKKAVGEELSVSAAAEIIKSIYDRCSTEIHNPADEVIPIRLGLLSEMDARVMVQLCEMYPVMYQVYSSSGDPLDNALYGASMR